MEVLFEYRGSRRQLTASSGENLVECITTELHRIGRARAQVYTANVDLSTVDRSREVYLLQKWSPQWGCYLDVNQASEITDGDRLAVVIKPKPPSKVNKPHSLCLDKQTFHFCTPTHNVHSIVSTAMLLLFQCTKPASSPGRYVGRLVGR